ncbi:hypothetical protein E8L90_07715 [Brevibacillus antibioticus]|uniref:Uncharacterized protein n=1 Tax=Brevibacillus antibioticus TaxID=2570228 RepID=A0A4U2Y4A4_9BACL|nr:hypothetical protein [Brevibacillus antibioticus]TKI55340.1 hypothetical protein E8L90_07715 [Brevibacillus antibioticus]
MDTQDETVKEINAKIRTLWKSVIVFGLFTIVGIFAGNVILILISLLFVIGGVWGIGKFKKTLQNQLTDYQPGKGFSFFRNTGEQKIKHITYVQYGLAGLILVCVLFNISTFYAISSGITVILVLQFIFKRRISLHTKIDDASLFELEEIGIITSKDIVNALYKDFESWTNVQPGNKVFLVKQDALVCIAMNENLKAVRREWQLRDIKKLGLLGGGNDGQGLLLFLGISQDEVIRLKMEGSSFQDSPEQFMTYFLQALDKAHLSTQVDNVKNTRDGRYLQTSENHNMSTPPSPSTNNRKLDIEVTDVTASTKMERSSSNGGRILDL